MMSHITNIDIDEQVTINTGLFFGLGPIEITVEARCEEGSSDEKTTEGTIFLFLITNP